MDHMVGAPVPALGPVARPARGAGAPDFSDVTSLEDAGRLVAEGRLFPVLLFPRAFGGTDAPENTVYVPRGVSAQMDRITAEVLRLVGERFAVTVDVIPERRGASVVPARIRVEAGLVATANAFEWSIEIW